MFSERLNIPRIERSGETSMSADSNAAAASRTAAAADDGRGVPPAGESPDDDVNEEDHLKRRRESSSSSSSPSKPTRKKKSRKVNAALPEVREGLKNASENLGETEGDELNDSSPEGDNLIDAEEVDNVETNAEGREQWTEVLSSDQIAQIRATKKAERIVRRQTWNTKSSASGFEVAFAPTDEGKVFHVNDLLKIFSDVRSVVVDGGRENIRVIHRAHVLFEILFLQRSCLKGKTDDTRARNRRVPRDFCPRNPRNPLAEPKGSVEPSLDNTDVEITSPLRWERFDLHARLIYPIAIVDTLYKVFSSRSKRQDPSAA